MLTITMNTWLHKKYEKVWLSPWVVNDTLSELAIRWKLLSKVIPFQLLAYERYYRVNSMNQLRQFNDSFITCCYISL